MQAVESLLAGFKRSREKVLLFSRSVQMMDILEAFLKSKSE